MEIVPGDRQIISTRKGYRIPKEFMRGKEQIPREQGLVTKHFPRHTQMFQDT